MSKSVVVISRIAGLLGELKKVLPAINFIEVAASNSDPVELKSSKIIIGDPDLIAPHFYNLQTTEWIQGTWAGIDKILPYIHPEKLPKFLYTRLTGENFGQLMGEYVLSNIIFYERNFLKVRENQKERQWIPEDCPRNHRSVADLTIGILGIGSIGNKIGKLLNNFGATIYGCGKKSVIPLESDNYSHVKKYFASANLADFLRNIDYLINVLPSTADTKNILGGNMLKNCKERSAVFINVGRGDVIKEADLVNALEKKWISGAILDVFDPEPLPKESPLWDMSNVFITPHIGGISRPQDIAAKFKKNFELYQRNLPLIDVADFVKGY